MPPRILDVSHCPHCKDALSKPTPRVCPTCGASLQQRHLSFGCLTSAPLLLVLAAWPACAAVRDAEAPSSAAPRAAADAPVAFPGRRP